MASSGGWTCPPQKGAALRARLRRPRRGVVLQGRRGQTALPPNRVLLCACYLPFLHAGSSGVFLQSTGGLPWDGSSPYVDTVTPANDVPARANSAIMRMERTFFIIKSPRVFKLSDWGYTAPGAPAARERGYCDIRASRVECREINVLRAVAAIRRGVKASPPGNAQYFPVAQSPESAAYSVFLPGDTAPWAAASFALAVCCEPSQGAVPAPCVLAAVLGPSRPIMGRRSAGR